MTRIGQLVPVLLGVMLLTVGCSQNPNKVMEKAVASMNEIENYTLVMDTKMVTDIQGQEVVTVNATNETKGVLKPEPIISITDKTILQYGETKEDDETVSYVAKDGDNIAYYEQQGDKWYKIVVEDMSLLGDMVKKPNKVAKTFVNAIDSFKMVGETTISDKQCYSIEGTVAEDKFLETLKMLEEIQDLGLEQDTMEAIQAQVTEPIKIQFFVDKETGNLITQKVELGSIMKLGMDEILKNEQSEATVNSVECEIKVTYENINSTKAPTVPEEVRAAQILE